MELNIFWVVSSFRLKYGDLFGHGVQNLRYIYIYTYIDYEHKFVCSACILLNAFFPTVHGCRFGSSRRRVVGREATGRTAFGGVYFSVVILY